MLGEFSARMASGARVLELGCGAGLPSTKELARRFVVTGVDISEAQVQAARHNVAEASFIHADMAQIDFPPGSFDGVTALYAIFHLPRDEHGRLFERVARWLVPGGLFLATLGSNDSPDWIGEWLGRQMFFSAYDAETNRRLLRDADFDLIIDEVLETIEPDGPVPFLWVLAATSKEAPTGGQSRRRTRRAALTRSSSDPPTVEDATAPRAASRASPAE
jgi:SAM-dependent methyltransferase